MRVPADLADAERQDRAVVWHHCLPDFVITCLCLLTRLPDCLCLYVPADLADAERQDREVAYKEKALEYHLAQVKESNNV
jgi:hypothetical protein